jgi:hypothetical protein
MNLPDKAIKLLRLALCDSAHEGERQNASIAFVSILKKNGISAESLTVSGFGGGQSTYGTKPHATSSNASSTKRQDKEEAPVFNMPFGKYKGQPISKVPSDYLYWMRDECTLGARVATALREEMERRGLI